MKQKRIRFAAGWLAMGVFCLVTGSADADSDGAVARAQKVSSGSAVIGYGTIRLDAQAQANSGITTKILEASHLHPETMAYGTVLDVMPLLEARRKQIAAGAELSAAQAEVVSAQQAYQRDSQLYAADRSVSQQTLEAAKAALATAQSRLTLARNSRAAIAEAVRQQYGKRPAAWLAKDPGGRLDDLANRRAVLIRLNLKDVVHPPRHLYVGLDDNRRWVALLVGDAPIMDPQTQAMGYIYRVDFGLPTGARLIAWVPQQGPAHSGVMIPDEAVVWNAGQPWAWVQIGKEKFERRSLQSAAVWRGGYWATKGFAPGDRVVVTGAELLLSEEMKASLDADGGDND